jgi:hypothetical protein
LNNPITITANSADFNPSITNPFTKCATINSAAAFNTQCNSILNISVLLAVAFLFVIPEGNLLFFCLSFPNLFVIPEGNLLLGLSFPNLFVIPEGNLLLGLSFPKGICFFRCFCPSLPPAYPNTAWG